MTADWTDDTLLGGRVRLRQPRDGLRAAIDPVLLAAGIPAKPGERVFEAGCGSGAAFLCLQARVPGLEVVAVERDPGLAALARHNAAANGNAGRVDVRDAELFGLAEPLPAVAHAFANPPWWAEGTASEDGRRRAATHLDGTDLAGWARALARPVRSGGTVSLLVPAARLDAALAALAAADCGGILVLPFWPRAGVAARRVLVQGRRHRRGPVVLAAGLVLHDGPAGFSAAADAVLLDGAALPRPAVGWQRRTADGGALPKPGG